MSKRFIYKPIKYIVRSIIALFLLFNALSCVKNDASSCLMEYDFLLKVINANDVDITQAGETGDVTLYTFDKNQQYVEQIVIPSIDVKNRVPVKLNLLSFENYEIIAWSNLQGNQDVTKLEVGTSLQQAMVKLKRTADEYAVNPDDIFFGSLSATSLATKTADAAIIMQRKTGKMSVTVRGLNPQNVLDYSVVVEGAKQDAFNFSGQLVGNPISYKRTGSFNNQRGDFMTGAFGVLPISAGNVLTVSVYQGSSLVATTSRDSFGNNIVPLAGETINVLIDLSGGASVYVSIMATEWNDVYQWLEW